MAIQNEKLAQALEQLRQTSAGKGVVRSSCFDRTSRDRLVKAGFLEEVINGWLIVTSPAEPSGSSASWYGCFWEFVSKYMETRFGDEYCLSAETSVKRLTGSTLIPLQVSVIVREPVAQVVRLKFGTSILIYQTKEPLPAGREMVDGLWLMDLPTAIGKLPPAFFRTNPDDAEIALRMVGEPSSLLRVLLDGNKVVVAGRLTGAYKFLGEERIAARIKASMEAAGNAVRISNPFETPEPALDGRSRIMSPHAARIRVMWSAMRNQVIGAFKGCEPGHAGAGAFLAEMEERYASDAYNSLSIEGYRVTPELIERVRSNAWNPDASEFDRQERDALAARRYYQAFQAVKKSIGEILSGGPCADVIDRDFQSWYREMFSPAVRAGILQANQLAGYRSVPVYLRGARHVPPAAEAVTDCMEAFTNLMRNEEEPVVRAVLGHFVFTYIHPYSDGNGRIARFIMNAAFASGGYPWTVIRQSRREEYLSALEEASTNRTLEPFARFVREEMEAESALPIKNKPIRKRQA